MVVLRCTQKLLARLKQSGDLPAIESTTRLGDWYGNILRIGARQHLLFVSERSRLPVIVPLREAKRLSTVFPEAVRDRLAVVGVTAADIAEERAQMSEMVFGRTRDRSLLGTMNDFAFMAQIVDRSRAAPGALRRRCWGWSALRWRHDRVRRGRRQRASGGARGDFPRHRLLGRHVSTVP